MMLVIDASALVAALVDSGADGTWAARQLEQASLAAPHLIMVEAANILRRSVRAGDISADTGALAHVDLVSLPIELYPYQPFAARVWELRENLTAYDAWHVALAEAIDAELFTLDERIARAPGVRCSLRLPAR